MSLFPSLNVTKSDVSRRTSTAGEETIVFPSTTLSETNLTLPNCEGCAHKSVHNPTCAIAVTIPHGEHRYQRIPVSNRPDIDTLNEIQTALFIAGSVNHGFIGNDCRYNVGATANNATKSVRYQIVSVSDTTITLKGPNPKCIQVSGVTRVNPNYPLPDPITGDTSRLVQLDAEYICLPLGSFIEFSQPSVLSGKMRPLITQITPPVSSSIENVTFTVSLNQDCSNAMEPYDEAFPADKYYCSVHYEWSLMTWGNFQAPNETAFTNHSKTISTAAVYELTDTGGGHARVLFPGMTPGAMSVTLTKADSSTVELPDSTILSMLSTTESGGTWTTTIDFSGYHFAAEYTQAVITYKPEAQSGDTERLQFQASCTNCQKEPTGSYTMDGDYTCNGGHDSTGFDDFHQSCWQPVGKTETGCNRFKLGDFPSEFNAEFLSRLWHRQNWYVQQSMAGVSSGPHAFTLARAPGGGFSIVTMYGGAREEVVPGRFAQRWPYSTKYWGNLIEYDNDSDEHLALETGAFWLKPYDLDVESYSWDATGNPEEGTVADGVSGWRTKTNALGATETGTRRNLPHRDTGRQDLYSYTSGGSAMAVSGERLADYACYFAGVSVTDEDVELIDIVEELFE